MDWARRIVVSGSGLSAEAYSADGSTDFINLAELYRRGIPAVDGALRRMRTVDFADFVPCDQSEYEAHIGISERTAEDCGHQVFELLSGGQRFLVPALVLMRAMFRPTSGLLVQMFAPSALDRICSIDHHSGEVSCTTNAGWTASKSGGRNRNWKLPLCWMALHPSARRMADSVHKHAMAGRLAIDLPKGRTELVLVGTQTCSSVVVTKIRLLTVFPGDAPASQIAPCASRMDFVDRARAKGRANNIPLSANLPPCIRENPKVTETEWAVLGPLLESKHRMRPFLHCQRKILNGVLEKLVSGNAWQKCAYEAGDWRNAAWAYRTWTHRGTFDQAIHVLTAMRTV